MKRGRLTRRTGLRRSKVDKGYDLRRAALWHQAVTVPGGKRQACAVCGSLSRIEAHHIIAKQTLTWVARERGYDPDRTQGLIWDARNGMALCATCHQRHETAFKRVPFAALPEASLTFARDNGLFYLIERYYPK